MTLIFVASLAAVGLFLGMLMLFEVGRFIGKRRLTRDPDGAAAGAGPAEAAVFGLLGLLLAFTFSGAASRFEDRRHLMDDCRLCEPARCLRECRESTAPRLE